MVVNFEYLKKEVSLPDFFKKIGWQLTEGSTKRSPKFTNGTQTVVVKKNKKDEYTYWDVHDLSNSGNSIIDLMRQHIYETTGKMPSLRQAGEALQVYVNNGEIILTKDSRFGVEASSTELSPAMIVSLLHELKPYQNDYLADRGISQETMTSPVFKDTFYSREYRKDGKIYNNTCVKLVNANGVQGISQRGLADGKKYKGVIGYKYGSIFTSNYDRSRPIDLIFVGESFIDNASHYQMKYLNTDKNILYISTEGNITKGQIELIQLLLSKQNIDIKNQLVYTFDNDHNGYLYTLNLDSYLKYQKIPEIENLTVEELREKVLQLPNVDLAINKDHNEDLQELKKKEFQEAVENNHYTRLVEMKKDPFFSPQNILTFLNSSDLSEQAAIVVQKIFDIKLDKVKSDSIKLTQNENQLLSLKNEKSLNIDI